MTHSPLEMAPVFRLGPVPITDPVIVTWAIMAVLVLFAAIVSRHLSLLPSKRQVTLEMLVGAVDSQIRDTMQAEPGPYRALIGTIFIFILIANWSSVIPGVEPPTAHIETDTALALIVFFATMFFGIRTRGLGGYLATFADPIWIMTPINVFEQFTRTFSLIVRTLRQHHERCVRHRHLAVAGGSSGADSLHGPRSADRSDPGLHLHSACHGLHRRKHCRRVERGLHPTESNIMNNLIQLVSIFAAAMAVSFGAIAPALGEGRAVAAAMDAIARQPDAAGTVSRTLFVGLAMIETMAIYCLVIALLVLFANPFIVK